MVHFPQSLQAALPKGRGDEARDQLMEREKALSDFPISDYGKLFDSERGKAVGPTQFWFREMQRIMILNSKLGEIMIICEKIMTSDSGR